MRNFCYYLKEQYQSELLLGMEVAAVAGRWLYQQYSPDFIKCA